MFTLRRFAVRALSMPGVCFTAKPCQDLGFLEQVWLFYNRKIEYRWSPSPFRPDALVSHSWVSGGHLAEKMRYAVRRVTVLNHERRRRRLWDPTRKRRGWRGSSLSGTQLKTWSLVVGIEKAAQSCAWAHSLFRCSWVRLRGGGWL